MKLPKGWHQIERDHCYADSVDPWGKPWCALVSLFEHESGNGPPGWYCWKRRRTGERSNNGPTAGPFKTVREAFAALARAETKGG